MATNGIRVDTSGINLGSFEDKLSAAVMMYGVSEAIRFESTAKEDRLWTDRTNDARNRLTGRFVEDPKGWVLMLSHGVEYGVWLELANERKYAILLPTIMKMKSPFVSSLQDLLGIKGGK